MVKAAEVPKSEETKKKTNIRHFEVVYHKGFYAPTLSFAEKLNNDSMSCVCSLNFDTGMLSVYDIRHGKKLHAIYPKTEIDPLETFDISTALFVLKSLPGQMMDAANTKKPEDKLLTITNIPGQGAQSIIFVLDCGKRAKALLQLLNRMQKNIGLSPEATQESQCSGIDKKYIEDLQATSSKFGIKAEDIITDRINQLEERISEAQELERWIHGDLRQQTSKCEARNHQIKIKENDIAVIKEKILEAKPQNSYRYIIPFGQKPPPLSIGKQIVADEECEKLYQQRAASRISKWRSFDSTVESTDHPTEIFSRDLLKQAHALNNKRIRIHRCL